SRRRHTRSKRDWSSDVCSSDLWGWGFARGVNYGPEPHIDAWVEHRGEKIYAQTTRRIDVDIRTVVANPEYDYAPTGFEARFDTKIGRASCREGRQIAEVEASVK